MNLPAVQPDQKPKRSRLLRFVILVSGWMFIVLGILGLFLPILQGILFLAIGASLLSMESPMARRFLERARRRYPKLGATFATARHRAPHILHRINTKLRKSTSQQKNGPETTGPVSLTRLPERLMAYASRVSPQHAPTAVPHQ